MKTARMMMGTNDDEKDYEIDKIYRRDRYSEEYEPEKFPTSRPASLPAPPDENESED